MTLRIGHLSTLYHTSMVMMAMPDLLEGFPAAVEWKLFGTGPAIVEAFSKGLIDIGYIGLPPAIIGIERGVRIQCIAGGHIEGTVIAAHKTAFGYPETDDLGAILSQFRSVGVPGKGSIHDLILMDAIRSHSVDVEVHNLQWSDQVLEKFADGTIDATVGTPALAQAVVRYANGRIIYPPDLLWPDNPSYGILVREEVIGRDRDLIKDFLFRHEKASEMLRNTTRDTAHKIADYMGVVDEAFVYDTITVSPHYCASLNEGYITCTMRLIERLRGLSYIKKEITREQVFDLSLIRDVHPEPDHYR